MCSDGTIRIAAFCDDSFTRAFYDRAGRLSDPFLCVVLYFVDCVRCIFVIVFVLCDKNKPWLAKFGSEYGFRAERPGIGKMSFAPRELDMLKSAWVIGTIFSEEEGQPAQRMVVVLLPSLEVPKGALAQEALKVGPQVLQQRLLSSAELRRK